MNIRKNGEGYYDPTAGKAIRKVDRPPEEVISFKRAVILLCSILHVRIQGKITVIDKKGRSR